jgi:hypothetical protein
MSIYDELKPLAAEILGEFKQGTIKLVRRVAGAGPIDNPGAATETETTLDAVAKGVTFRYVKDGFALSTDLMVTSAVVDGVTPTKDDFIDIDGTRYKIVEDISPPAAGTRVVWKFIVRK